MMVGVIQELQKTLQTELKLGRSETHHSAQRRLASGLSPAPRWLYALMSTQHEDERTSTEEQSEEVDELTGLFYLLISVTLENGFTVSAYCALGQRILKWQPRCLLLVFYIGGADRAVETNLVFSVVHDGQLQRLIITCNRAPKLAKGCSYCSYYITSTLTIWETNLDVVCEDMQFNSSVTDPPLSTEAARWIRPHVRGPKK